MDLKLESENLNDYLGEVPPAIVYQTSIIQQKIQEIEGKVSSLRDRAEMAFEIARDEIRHSFDSKGTLITISGAQALEKKEGICFAKAHLLATLLRGMGIPAGFCYQRVLRKGTVDSGYALHGLNAVYLQEVGWFRVDPRGNKVGIHSEFSPNIERLAYPIRTELGEVDYPNVYTKPLDSVLQAMQESKDAQELFYKRPEKIS